MSRIYKSDLLQEIYLQEMFLFYKIWLQGHRRKIIVINSDSKYLWSLDLMILTQHLKFHSDIMHAFMCHKDTVINSRILRCLM
jgi:hypothetical protein